jgi:hypothetical protein
MPVRPLPEITFRAVPRPPIRLFAPPLIRRPSKVFGRARVPEASVPMKFPWIVVDVTPTPWTMIPEEFCEITFPAPGWVPPIWVPLAALEMIPLAPLPSGATPLAPRPM